ncbi:hypothetical protein AVEN_13501-1, partial [Araneus ventricosus]
HFTAKLSVRMADGPDLVATNFDFYDCSTYTSCTQCVSSNFPCDWCLTGHRCTHDTGENCRNDVLVTGVARVGRSIRPGPGFCLRINKTANGSTEILVASGVSKRIAVKVDNIQRSNFDYVPDGSLGLRVMDLWPNSTERCAMNGLDVH